MTDLEELILDFITELHFLKKEGVAGTYTSGKVNQSITIDEIDMQFTNDTTFGAVNDSIITILTPQYRIRYHRRWPDWDMQFDNYKRLRGFEEFDITGDVDVFKDHVTYIRLRY